MIRDGEAAFDWLHGKTGGGPILLFGHSLGGAVAAQIALRRNGAGLILESTFTSVPEMARRTLPELIKINEDLSKLDARMEALSGAGLSSHRIRKKISVIRRRGIHLGIIDANNFLDGMEFERKERF